MTDAPALELRDVCKHFGGVAALSDVSLRVERGHVHSLLGQNGSGKSTVVKILSGYHAPEPGAAGELAGEPLSFPIRNSVELGIALIHQDLALAERLTVLENVGIAVAYGTARGRRIDWQRERGELDALCERFSIALDADRPVAELSPAEHAYVAILRAVRQMQGVEPRLFVLDEPTAYLSASEARRVTGLMRTVAETGAGVIFITHKLGEALEVSERITVLRSGRVQATLEANETTPQTLIETMLGRPAGDLAPRAEVGAGGRGEPLLRVEGLAGELLDGVGLELHCGEVVGVTGLAGMGQEELPYILAGVRPRKRGTVLLGGREVAGATVRALARRGLVLVPGNRQRDGLWLQANARENLTLPGLSRFAAGGRIRVRDERRHATALLERFHVVPPDCEKPVRDFSGGNQQKILLAKWLGGDPDVLVLDEPTQGVDIGARREILQQLTERAEAGAAVLICSNDQEQLAEIATRVLVLRYGRVVAELSSARLSEEEILAAVG